MKLLAIDGNSIINRAFYGIRLLSNKRGQYTNAIYGFINILLKLTDEQKPDGVAVAFDLKAHSGTKNMLNTRPAESLCPKNCEDSSQ